jgi:KDO2-lipid IV(A) lauroyltransferase
VGRLLHIFLAGKRRLARESLRISFPEWTDEKVREIARKNFITQGLLLAEILRRIGRPEHDPLDDIESDPAVIAKFSAAMNEGRGGLVLTGHVNNYEYLSAWAARIYPMTIIAKPIKPPALGAFVMKMRADSGIQELPHHRSYRAALRAVQSGGCLGFIIDQNMTHNEGVFVSFFKRPACTSAGLAMLSAQTGVPVVPVFLLRDGHRYRVKVYDAIPPPPDRAIETLHDYTQRYTNAIERAVREQPESWIWMHKRWKTRPKPGDRITMADGSVRHV